LIAALADAIISQITKTPVGLADTLAVAKRAALTSFPLLTTEIYVALAGDADFGRLLEIGLDINRALDPIRHTKGTAA
jgi:hypothetical protein